MAIFIYVLLNGVSDLNEYSIELVIYRVIQIMIKKSGLSLHTGFGLLCLSVVTITSSSTSL